MTGVSTILEVTELSMPWVGIDPFIMTVHHLDHYPSGNAVQGPATSLRNRNLGSDFSYLDGWSMYHGIEVPGFPQHPHRGFETVTVVRRGYVDHSDSLGATARYGQGDTQWLTTGSGIQHSEMFPLISEEGPNELELFQIWLNLPPESKMVPAHFGMLWGEEIPTVVSQDGGVTVDVIAGVLDGHTAPTPPPNSWASQPNTHMAIWLIRLDEGASWDLPATASGINRTLHFFHGTEIEIAGARIPHNTGVRVRSEVPTSIRNPGPPAELLLLQGRPIGAPVFQMGPFVMNSAEELRQAVIDYQRTEFGGWPWANREPVHAREQGRFAIHADGHIEYRDRPELATEPESLRPVVER